MFTAKLESVDKYLTYALEGEWRDNDNFLAIETAVFWQDEYELSPIANRFLSEKVKTDIEMASYLKRVTEQQSKLKNEENHREKMHMFMLNVFG